jgi:predicted ferric reductase
MSDSVKINAVETEDGYFTKTELKKMKKKVTVYLCDYYGCGPQELNHFIKEDIERMKRK